MYRNMIKVASIFSVLLEVAHKYLLVGVQENCDTWLKSRDIVPLREMAGGRGGATT